MPKNLSWKRASEIFKDAVLWKDDISPNDIKQGKLGNCYYLATLASLAENPQQIKALFHQTEINSAGVYLVYFFVNGFGSGVIVDDYLPVTEDGQIAFGSCKD